MFTVNGRCLLLKNNLLKLTFLSNVVLFTVYLLCIDNTSRLAIANVCALKVVVFLLKMCIPEITNTKL